MEAVPPPDRPELLDAQAPELLIRHYEQQIEAHPDWGDNYWQLGLLHFRSGDLEQAQLVWWSGLWAIEAANEATGEPTGEGISSSTEISTETATDAVHESDNQPESLSAGLATLVALLETEAIQQQQLGRSDRAENLYRLLLELSPSAVCYEALGQVLSLQGRLDEALDCWQQAIEREPNWSQPYRQQGQVWEALADWQRALSAYQQSHRLDWQLATAEAIGRCFSQLHQWAAAIEHLSEVLAVRLAVRATERSAQTSLTAAQTAAIQADLSWAQLRQQQIPEAVMTFHQSVWGQSNFGSTYLEWGDRCTQQGRATARQTQLAALLSSLQSLDTAAVVAQLNQLGTQRVAQPPPALPRSPAADPLPYYETTQTWAADRPDIHHPDTNYLDAIGYQPLDPPSWLTLTPPQTLDPDLHFSFRFPPQIPLPGAFVVEIPNGRFWSAADQSSIAVLTAEEQMLGDLCFEFPLLTPDHPDAHPSRHSLRSRDLPPLQSIAGRVVVLAGLTDGMYFHWMLEVLPKLDLLQRAMAVHSPAASVWDQIDAVILSASLPFQQETLRQLGVPASKILDWTGAEAGDCYLQADRLIVPSFPARPAWTPRWVCEFLRRSFLPASPQNHGLRLYLSRQKAANRRIINEAEVEDILTDYGFQTVYLEALSVAEQAALLAQAERVVAVHGSGLTNLVFCRPGTQVLELFAPDFVYPCYWALSHWMQLDYTYLIGQSPIGSFWSQVFDPNPRLADLWVDRSQLVAILQHWERGEG